MPGTTAVTGIVAAAAVLASGLAMVGGAAARAPASAADASRCPTTAADAASGAIPGVPCDRAAEVAGTFGAAVEACDLDGLIATITVSAQLGPITAQAAARAGPPP